jgi:predicted RNA binding protein YcfA (HicA-like mRNA interferase family)
MKTPKVVKGDKLIKALSKRGFEVKSRKGSHISLSNGTVHLTVVLPLTTIGVFLKICRITGIPKEELLEEL